MSDYIPEDCRPEILKQLPAKSLARFRCVCRRWNALICSSSFIADHHSCSKAKPRFFIDNVCQRPSKHKSCVIVDSDSHDEDAATFIPHIMTAQIPVLDGLNYYQLVGSAKGIICFHAFDDYIPMGVIKRQEILLWNPMISKYIKLPEAHTSSPSFLGYVSTAIGVKPSEEDDLRVLKVSASQSNRHVPAVVAEVYSVRQGNWRVLHTPCRHNLFCGSVLRPCVNGAVYWVAMKYNPPRNQLIRFGFEEEEFSCITLPDVLAHTNDHLILYVGAYCGRLALFQYLDSSWTIWTREADSWSVVTCFDEFQRGGFIHGITHDGQILMPVSDFDCDDDDGDLVLYNPTSRTFHDLGVQSPRVPRPDACPFVESLVFMDGEGGAVAHSSPLRFE